MVLPAAALGQEARIRAWVEGLASENFRERVEAQEKLLEWGRSSPARAMDLLFAEQDAATDAEARIRLREALRELVVADHQNNHGEGYVGVRMAEVPAVVPGVKIPRTGIQVVFVEPGSPGDRAGLVVGDVIVSFEHLRWTGQGAVDAFTNAVRRCKPRETVKLGVLRDGELKEVPVTLGIRRLGLSEKGDLLWPNGMHPALPDTGAAEDKAKEEIFRAWMERKRAAKKVP